MKKISKIVRRCYLGGSLAVMLPFFGSTMLGLDGTKPPERIMPSEVRQSPGGFRGFHFWHSGYRGGK